MKTFNTSPLPFHGQKRNFLRAFKQALNKYPAKGTYVDLFGGSGLLSNTVKTVYPNANVIYNDFDGFMRRIEAIPETNALLCKMRSILPSCERKLKVTGTQREQITVLLKNAANKGYSDWITISSNLLFSMNYSTNIEGILKETLYNKVRLSDYDATGYLQGVNVVCSDYRQLFEQYKKAANVVFLVDPPYLSTDTTTYASESYWRLKDYLNVLQVLKDSNYFYFTSNKSQIVELCEWISSVSATANPFANATMSAVNTSTSHNSRYTDLMYHYKKS